MTQMRDVLTHLEEVVAKKKLVLTAWRLKKQKDQELFGNGGTLP